VAERLQFAAAGHQTGQLVPGDLALLVDQPAVIVVAGVSPSARASAACPSRRDRVDDLLKELP